MNHKKQKETKSKRSPSRALILLYGGFGIALIVIIAFLIVFVLNSFTIEKVYPGS